jgi:carboxyl-terminal processing protease
MTFKRIFALAVVALSFSSVAEAQKFIGSPAQDLYDQATFYLDTQYYGPSKVDVKALIATYQAKVDEACAPQALQCGFDKVEPLLEVMFSELKDFHAYYLTAEDVRAESANRGGNNASPTPRVGIASRGFCETPTGNCEVDAMGQITSKLLSDRLIVNIVAGGPADKAGIKYGDRWLGYNGVLFSSLTPGSAEYTKFNNDFGAKIRAGETITMALQRGPNKQRLDIPVKGEIINLAEQPSLELRSDGVAILTLKDYLIQGIGQKVHDLMRDAIAKGVKGVIVNMRGNGGGYGNERGLAQGAFMENPEFFRRVPRYNPEKSGIEEGYLTAQGAYVIRNLQGVELQRSALRNPQLFKGPIAVLVNGGCASACEYFASTVQRVKRGAVIGEDTVGIGNTNSARFPLLNGGAAAMPTVQAFWLDGTSLPATVKPDIVTPNYEFELFNTGVDSGVAKALQSMGVASPATLEASSVTLRAPAGIPVMAGADLIGSLWNSVDVRAPHSNANLQSN